ncbi:MAG TPA: glycine cleavage system protein H [bacterium]|nr:glycine cleavage system protein H [bacterium]
MILALVLTIIGFMVVGTLGFIVWAAIGAKGTIIHRIRGLQKVDGFFWHPDLFYHSGHAWAKLEEDGAIRVGVDDFAQKLMDGARKVSLPHEGAWVWTGESAMEVECGLRKARIASPVDGIVVEVNEGLNRDGSSLNQDPFGRGWTFLVKPVSGKFRNLLSGDVAREWLEREIERLYQFFYTELGASAADGGELVSRPASKLHDREWRALTRTFFHTS